MKIVILTKFSNGKPPISLNMCQNKFQVYTYLLYKYLNRKDNVEIVFNILPLRGKGITNNHSLSKYNIHKGDHVIVVDDRGFKSRNKKFKEKLREHISGAITSIGISSVYFGGEDKFFYMDNCSLKRNNTECIGWLCDEDDFIPNQEIGLIKILVQKPENNIHGRLDYYHDVLDNITKFIDANQNNIEVDVGILGNKFYENLKTGETIIFKNYAEKYDIMRQTDIYFITSDAFNREILYEFGLSNTLIVTNKNMINDSIIKYFDIVYYKKNIPWSTIIESINNIKSRNKIINDNCTAKKSIDIIYQYFDSYNNFKDITKVIDENKVKNSKFYRTRKAYKEKLDKEKKLKDELVKNNKSTNMGIIDNNDKSTKNKISKEKPKVERESGLRLVQSRLRLN
jgi:hypothetical protein